MARHGEGAGDAESAGCGFVCLSVCGFGCCCQRHRDEAKGRKGRRERREEEGATHCSRLQRMNASAGEWTTTTIAARAWLASLRFSLHTTIPPRCRCRHCHLRCSLLLTRARIRTFGTHHIAHLDYSPRPPRRHCSTKREARRPSRRFAALVSTRLISSDGVGGIVRSELRPWCACAERWVTLWASRRTFGSSSTRRELRMRPKSRRTRSNSYESTRATAALVTAPLEHMGARARG